MVHLGGGYFAHAHPALRGGKLKASTGFNTAATLSLVGSFAQPELAPVLLPFSGISTGIGRVLGAFGAGIDQPKPNKVRRKKSKKKVTKNRRIKK